MKTKTVTATEANRSFSKWLHTAMQGERVVITSHGKKVAAIVPLTEDDSDESVRQRQLAALAKIQKRWATREFKVVGPWNREDLYDRD